MRGLNKSISLKSFIKESNILFGSALKRIRAILDEKNNLTESLSCLLSIKY